MKNYDVRTMYEWSLPARLVIMGFCCLVVFYLGYVLDVSKTLRLLNLNEQQEQDLKQQYEIQIRQVYALKADIEHHGQLENTLKEWQAKLINPTRLPETLNEILKIGAISNLQFSRFNPSDAVDAGQYKKVLISVTASGQYDEIGRFLSQIANLSSIVTIGNFTLTKPNRVATANEESGDIALPLVLDLTLEIYYPAGSA